MLLEWLDERIFVIATAAAPPRDRHGRGMHNCSKTLTLRASYNASAGKHAFFTKNVAKLCIFANLNEAADLKVILVATGRQLCERYTLVAGVNPILDHFRSNPNVRFEAHWREKNPPKTVSTGFSKHTLSTVDSALKS